MFSWFAHVIERYPWLHQAALRLWRRFPPRLAGLMKVMLTTKWTVGAVAVIVDREAIAPEVLLVEHSYRIRGAWGLPGGALDSSVASPLKSRKEDNVLEAALRREVFEELGIEVEIQRLIRIDAIPYVPEEPGPSRLDFYFACAPKGGMKTLKEGLASGTVRPRSPEVKTIRFVPLRALGDYDLYSSDAELFRDHMSDVVPFAGTSMRDTVE